MIREEIVAMYMNTFRVSTAPKCPQCGDSKRHEVTFGKLATVKCANCGTAIPKQTCVEAVYSVTQMHLFGDDNVDSGMEALRRSGLHTI